MTTALSNTIRWSIGHGVEKERISFVDLDFEYIVHTYVEYLAIL